MVSRKGVIRIQNWYLNGQYHRENDLPIQVHYHENGGIALSFWHLNGQLQRAGDLPARIANHENGSVSEEEWYQDFQLHRENDLPAVVNYHEDGSLELQSWYRNGLLDRPHSEQSRSTSDQQEHVDQDLPAKINYHKDGSVVSQWYVQGTLQWELVTRPEPALEDLVKPASHAQACNIQEPVRPSDWVAEFSVQTTLAAELQASDNLLEE